MSDGDSKTSDNAKPASVQPTGVDATGSGQVGTPPPAQPAEQAESFEALLAEQERSDPTAGRSERIEVGDKVRGRVSSVGTSAVFVELGGKAEAVLDLEQVTDAEGKLTVALGDTIEAIVAEIRGDGTVILRTSMGRGASRGPDALAELEQAHAHQLPVEGLVTGVNKGGVEVQVAGVRAFCPVSQLDTRFVEDAGEYVGQRLTFRISRFEGGKRPNVVLTRRALLEEEAAERAAETRATLREGAVFEGTVTTIKPYGAFVDIGGLEGLLHISELGFERVEHPGDVLAVGKSLEVQVIKIEKTGDPKRPEKIGLSLKALLRDPWSEVADQFQVGTKVSGKVVRMQPYGVFVEIAPGVEGLVHISELGAGRRIGHPREVVSDGQQVEVMVLKVEADKRRLSLSIGAAQDGELDGGFDPHEDPGPDSLDEPGGGQALGTLGDLFRNPKGEGRRGRRDGKGKRRKR